MFLDEIYRLQATHGLARHLYLACASDQQTFRKNRVESWVDAARKEVLPRAHLDGKRVKLDDAHLSDAVRLKDKPADWPPLDCKLVKLDDSQLSDAVRFKDKPQGWPFICPQCDHPRDDETIPLFTDGANGVNSVDSVEDALCHRSTGVWEWTSFRHTHPAPLGHYGEQRGPGWTNYMDHGFPRKQIPEQEFPW